MFVRPSSLRTTEPSGGTLATTERRSASVLLGSAFDALPASGVPTVPRLRGSRGLLRPMYRHGGTRTGTMSRDRRDRYRRRSAAGGGRDPRLVVGPEDHEMAGAPILATSRARHGLGRAATFAPAAAKRVVSP